MADRGVTPAERVVHTGNPHKRFAAAAGNPGMAPLDTSLEVTIDGPGQRVQFVLVVENGDDQPVSVTFRDSGDTDFAVRRSDGEEVWRWSEGRMFAQALRPAEFAPGESASFEAEWPDPEPGDYTAIGELRVREAEVRAETPFSV